MGWVIKLEQILIHEETIPRALFCLITSFYNFSLLIKLVICQDYVSLTMYNVRDLLLTQK